MLKDIEKINIILNERTSLRDEIIEFEKMIFFIGKVLLTSTIAIVAIYFDNKIISDDETRKLILIILSQLEFILGMVISFILISMQVTAGYIAGLEKKINEISKETITIWESDVSKNYFYSIKKSSLRVTYTLFGIGTIIFVLIYLVKIKSMLYGIIVLVEIFIIIWLLKKALMKGKK